MAIINGYIVDDDDNRIMLLLTDLCTASGVAPPRSNKLEDALKTIDDLLNYIGEPGFEDTPDIDLLVMRNLLVAARDEIRIALKNDLLNPEGVKGGLPGLKELCDSALPSKSMVDEEVEIIYVSALKKGLQGELGTFDFLLELCDGFGITEPASNNKEEMLATIDELLGCIGEPGKLSLGHVIIKILENDSAELQSAIKPQFH